jgi:hypothetical protein
MLSTSGRPALFSNNSLLNSLSYNRSPQLSDSETPFIISGKEEASPITLFNGY